MRSPFSVALSHVAQHRDGSKAATRSLRRLGAQSSNPANVEKESSQPHAATFGHNCTQHTSQQPGVRSSVRLRASASVIENGRADLHALTTPVICVVMSSSAGKKPVPVYLRGLPPDLVREAKAIAARRGVTLANFVAESLTRAIAADADSTLTSVRGTDRALAHSANDAVNAQSHIESVGPLSGTADVERELSWYENNREQLARQYGDEFVAIIDNRVVDHDVEFEPLAERMFAAHGERGIFMPKVRTAERTLRLRSPRIARPA